MARQPINSISFLYQIRLPIEIAKHKQHEQILGSHYEGNRFRI